MANYRYVGVIASEEPYAEIIFQESINPVQGSPCNTFCRAGNSDIVISYNDTKVLFAEFVGIEGLTVNANNINVAINQGGGTLNGIDNDSVVAFDAKPLDVKTGSLANEKITLDFLKSYLA